MKLYESSVQVYQTPDIVWQSIIEYFQDENAQLFFIESSLPSLPSMADIKLISKYGFRRKVNKGVVSISEPPRKLSLEFSPFLSFFRTREVWTITIESKSDFASVITFSSYIRGWLALRHMRSVNTERQLQIDKFVHTLKNKVEVVRNVQSD